MHPLPRALLFAALSAVRLLAGGPVDALTFGDPASEAEHGLVSKHSEAVRGLLEETARKLQPLEPVAWNGGTLDFTLKVDPENQNYLTIKLSGSDISDNRLLLLVEGKQVGWRHLGEVEQLDFGTTGPGYLGRFTYQTTPLPVTLTRGKKQVSLQIQSSGPIWGYGTTWERYQKTMTEPSRGLYRVYSHTAPCFVPPDSERQGSVDERTAQVAPKPGPEILEQVRARVNREIEARLAAERPNSQMQLQLLARAYDVSWTVAHANPAVIERLLEGLDALYRAWRLDPSLARSEPSTWNPEWFGLGVCGEVLFLRRVELAPHLKESIEVEDGTRVVRAKGYADMLVECRDWHQRNRRQYTNQSMLNDLNGIYNANRGLRVVAPERASPEEEMRRYLHESVGLIPWSGSKSENRNWGVGNDYLQVTAKGLTKELGYVGSYGEVLDLVADIYNATRPTPHEPGDERIRAQMVKMAVARSYFRHPGLDERGHRVMRLEQVVGWRDSHHPGYLAYGQRPTRDASALQVAAITLDPVLVGQARQMLDDNQFFASEVIAMADRAQPLRTTIGRLSTPEEYDKILAQPDSGHRLPMTWGQPDCLFSDEENGVLALKSGDEILYVSLYWRARTSINNLARVHHLTPNFERIAVVAVETEFTPSGLFATMPDWTNMAFGNGGLRYPGAAPSAYAGERRPIAKIPEGIDFKPGQENVYAGKGDFYRLHYGDYLIGMNLTKDRTFELAVPAGFEGTRLGSNAGAPPTARTIPVGPRTTVVLRRKR